jgi:hypothetical protein
VNPVSPGDNLRAEIHGLAYVGAGGSLVACGRGSTGGVRRPNGGLYDEEQQRAILTAAGVAWRRQLKLVGILVRTAPADGRAAIRRREDEVDKLLPENPASPIKLRASLSELLPGHPSLVDAFVPRLTDSVAAPGADQETVLALAAEHGVETNHTDLINRALQAPRTALSRRVRESIKTMQQNALRVATPKGLAPPPPTAISSSSIAPRT